MRILEKLILFSLIFLSEFHSLAQDTAYARRVINKLCAKELAGRGYVADGDKLAAQYIAKEFEGLKVSKLAADYFQPFSFPVNTFPSKMEVKINKKILVPGKDFIVNQSSASAKGKFSAKILKNYNSIINLANPHKTCFVIYKDSISNDDFLKLQSDLRANEIKKGAFIFVEPKKLTWSVATNTYSVPVITLMQSVAPLEGETVCLNIKAAYNPKHKTQNVIGIINSPVKTDTTIVFTAHYDHLGMMGKNTCFPGANDNASGISILLNLAKYYSVNRDYLSYNMMFIAFAGEEAGLIGSKFYTENPLLPLNKIKFLINMDLMGTGDDGMMVVNATEYKAQFELLKNINERRNYVVKIGERGKAKNSDHYYFSEKGVPCFFFYTMGGIAAYHDVYDISETLPLTDYTDVFKLITEFVSEL